HGRVRPDEPRLPVGPEPLLLGRRGSALQPRRDRAPRAALLAAERPVLRVADEPLQPPPRADRAPPPPPRPARPKEQPPPLPHPRLHPQPAEYIADLPHARRMAVAGAQ